MRYRVVCIAGADGAGAEEIAQLVAEQLDFRLVHEEIVAQAASSAGVQPEVVADVEQRKSRLARLLEEFGPSSIELGYVFGYVSPDASEALPSRAALQGLIRTAIEETAAEGEVVILAHGASHALVERVDVLRALVTGSPDTRRDRLMRMRRLDEQQAATLIERADRARADYLKRFYGLPLELPTYYDLVLNTDRLPLQQAAELIIRTARAE